MELFWPLVIVRWLHLWSLIALFGSALFAIYYEPQPNRAKDMAPARAVSWLAGATLASGVGWLALSLLDAAEELEALVSPSRWRAYFLETGFGRIWMLRLVGLLALVGVIWRPWWQRGYAARPIAGLSAALLVSVGWLGHAASGEGADHFAGLLAYGCHVLAAGAWLGGLLPLSMALCSARAGGDRADLRARLESFSRLGTVAVALILASGVVSAGLRIEAAANLFVTTWGQVLLGKIALFALLLAIAAANRWIFLRQLRQAGGTGAIQALSRSVLLEQLIGVGVVALAATLSSLAPSQ